MHRFVAAVAMAAALSVSAGAVAQSTVERGRYLVESIVGCGNCHTPQGPNMIPLPPNYGPPIDKPVEAPPRSDTLAYGAYLAGPLGHCLECHTPPAADGRTLYDSLRGAGGRHFPGPWGLSVSKNITTDSEQGLGKWSDAEIERAIRKGIDRHGQPLKPPRGFAYYDRIAAEDMAALIAYLRSLPARKTP